ncbi:Gx transporter family protein [Paenibacillus larvae]|nr:Gx transporter family protein [Paenibacillus larvae]MCY9562834.1 Gx transporter family protein [Paenibacillus larvae]
MKSMPQPNSMRETSSALKKAVIIAIFAAVAAVLSVVETMIPMGVQIPGIKLGLANIMVLTCLYFMKGRDAFSLIILKTILTAFLFGTFSVFLFSFFGALFSFVVMLLLMKLGKKEFSLTGISIAGGIFHNIGQLTAAMIVMKSSVIFYYLPALMFSGVVTGVFIGIAVRYLTAAFSKLSLFESFLAEEA